MYAWAEETWLAKVARDLAGMDPDARLEDAVDVIINALFRAVVMGDSLDLSAVDGLEEIPAPSQFSIRGWGLLSSG